MEVFSEIIFRAVAIHQGEFVKQSQWNWYVYMKSTLKGIHHSKIQSFRPPKLAKS